MPDEVTVELWRVRIENCVEARTFKPDIDYLVLDGIPRNVRQAEIMADIIDVRQVFHLSCPDRSKLVTRLKKRALKDNRLDDANDEIIRKRLLTYESESKPLLDFYGQDLVVNIDATEPPVLVMNRIVSSIVNDRRTMTDFTELRGTDGAD